MQVRCSGFFQNGWQGLSADPEPRGLEEGSTSPTVNVRKWMKALNPRWNLILRAPRLACLIWCTIRRSARPDNCAYSPWCDIAKVFSCGRPARANFNELLGPHNVPLPRGWAATPLGLQRSNSQRLFCHAETPSSQFAIHIQPSAKVWTWNSQLKWELISIWS